MWSFEDAEGSGSFLASDLQPGSLFGDRFEIVAPLGSGGMGVVYEAHDQATGRRVAIKVQHLRSVNQERTQRFQREGILTARLRHHGILRIHGGGVTNEGRSFLILEMIENARTLDEALGEDHGRGLEILLELARAVAYAHEAGVIHRDLKPSNVLVDPSGHVRVCDFGLAWAPDSDRLTQTNAMLGTPLYLAPECFARGPGAAQATSDVWAMGVMLYEHLTGSHPFPGPGLGELILQAKSGQIVPPIKRRPETPPALNAVCMKALATKVSERYPNAGAFADALDGAILVRTQQTRPRRRWPLVVVTVAGLTVLALGGVLWKGLPSEPTPPPEVAQTLEPTSTPRPSPPPEVTLPPGFEQLIRRARVPGPFQPEIVARFDALLALDGVDQPRIQLERLRYLLRRGRWRQVLDEVPLLEANTGEIGAEAVLLRAQASYGLRRTEEITLPRAAAPIQRWLRRDNKATPAARAAIEAYAALFEGKTKLALSLARRACELDPTSAAAGLVQAVALGRLNRIDESLRCLEQVLEHAPDHPVVLFMRAVALTKVRKPEEAYRSSASALALVRPDPPQHLLMAHMRFLANSAKYTQIEATARKELEQEPGNLSWRFTLGYAQMRQPASRFTGWSALRKIWLENPSGYEKLVNAYASPPYRKTFFRYLERTPIQVIRAGVLYEQGAKAFTDGKHARARELLTQAAAANNHDAQALLGESWFLGWGGPKDPKLAAKWLRKAAEGGQPYGMFGLARCYQSGTGVPKDDKLAFAWFRKAADKGSNRAKVNLGQLYRDGRGTRRDPVMAIKVWSEAAKAGFPLAMINLGNYYATLGKPRTALHWFRKSLQHDDPVRPSNATQLASDAIRRLKRDFPELNDPLKR